MKIIKCSECKWFYKNGELRIALNFYEKTIPTDKPICCGEIYCEGEYLKMCQNPICFEYYEESDPVNGKYKVKKRISGQGMLNWNNKCKYFETNLFTKILNYFRKKR